jgi:hypothetical protein
MSDYETDILAWSERQGALLRRLAAGERVNDADLDWPNKLGSGSADLWRPKLLFSTI